MELSLRIQALSESATIAMAQKSRELADQGVQVINLSLGEPDFNTPDFIKDAAKQGIDENYTRYMPVPGYLDLRQAISEKFKRENNLNYSPDQIVVSTGAKQSLANVILSVVNPGDEVILPAPYWVSYKELVKLAEGIPVEIPTSIDDDFKMTPEVLKQYVTPKTKLLLYSSPCNPTGSVYNREELEALAAYIESETSMWVMADEIYEYINYVGEHVSIATIGNMYDRTITVNGVSKGYAMTGWRVGYIGAPLALAKACNKMQGQVTSGTCSIGQRAALAAVQGGYNSVSYMKDKFLERRDLLVAGLREIEGIKVNSPDGAFYVFPNVEHFFGKSHNGFTVNDANDLALYLLNDAHVATVTGDAFGAPGYIRISYAASNEEIIEAIARIKKALANLA